MTLEAVPLALVIDAVTGEPPRLWSRVGHPVAWMGAVIDRLDGALNAGRRRDGVVALALATTAFAVPAALVAGLVGALPAGIVIEAALASTLLAHRSLHDHVAAVERARTPAEAREAVARIVGRDTATLDEAGVARAALETLGENLSDGVVAPAFWFALGGLPGLVAYKVVSTADSMIGHRTPRHEAFGWAAARADDALEPRAGAPHRARHRAGAPRRRHPRTRPCATARAGMPRPTPDGPRPPSPLPSAWRWAAHDGTARARWAAFG